MVKALQDDIAASDLKWARINRFEEMLAHRDFKALLKKLYEQVKRKLWKKFKEG